MENVTDILQEQARDALQKLGAQGIGMAERVAQSVLTQAVYWEEAMSNGEKLLFVRLFSPVVQREEVFLGNILFNAFLSKAFARAVSGSGLGKAELVANDLESHYFLVRTTHDLSELVTTFRGEVEHGLPDLFFGDQDEDRGIYGSLETMLDFDKANVEPFPIFIMPQSYEERLDVAVRKSLLHKIENSPLERNPTSIMANLAFFYSRDGPEMQSPYLFLARLALRYGVVHMDSLRQALNLDAAMELDDEATAKTIIEESLKQKEGRTFSSTHLRQVLEQAVVNLGKRIEVEPDAWRMPYVRAKFLPYDEKTLTGMLLDDVLLGYTPVYSSKKRVDVGCRICGIRLMEVADKSILMGQNTHKFHNQSGKQTGKDAAKTCLRCAACTYLMVKLIGSEAVGQPQVPKTYNLIFHYGRHSNDDVVRLAQRVDLIWNLVQRHRSAERTRYDIDEQHKLLINKAERERDAQKKQALAIEIAQKEVELQQAHRAVAQAEDSILTDFPWLKETGASPVPAENPSLDVWANVQLSETKVEWHILGLGMGGYRMILFVLPQIRPPRDKEHDFAQRRFSNSRVTVLALLSFLRETCGCDGPFYYQSLPTLAPGAFQRDTFYVRNEPIQAEEAQKRYGVITQLAWCLVWQRGSEGFVKKVVLAEKLLKDPLATFAAVMRDSPILGQTKGSYKCLPGQYRQDWKAYDLTEYAKFIQQLAKL